jgi:hypothetical protein
MTGISDPANGERYIRLSRELHPKYSRFVLVREANGYAILLREDPSYALHPSEDGLTLMVKKSEFIGSGPTFQTHNVEPIPE